VQTIPESWPSLEVRVKSLNYIGDLLLKFLQRFHDKRAVLERYFGGELDVHHHSTGTGYCAVTHVANAGKYGNEPAMLVGVGKIAERLGPFAAVTRLQPLERCLVIGSEFVEPEFSLFAATYASAGKILVPRLWRIFDRKFRIVLGLSRVQVEKLIDEIIESGPEIVDRLPDQNGDDWGCGDVLSLTADKAGPHCQPRDRLVRRRDGSYLLLDSCDMLLCPAYSRSRIIKGWLRTIGVHYELSRSTKGHKAPHGRTIANAA
jgi:hypothetical protein